MTNLELIIILLIPFIGTTLGAATVLFLKNQLSVRVSHIFSGFAAGVMVAASIWSLIIPSMDLSSPLGKLSFIPALVGFWLGVLFLLAMDTITPHIHMGGEPEGPRAKLKRTTKMLFAIMLHNVPEGMAIGIVIAGFLNGDSIAMPLSAVVALAIGIGIQNFPEGAIISLPLKAEGFSKSRAFLFGAASGAIEPVAAVITILLASFILPLLPYLLAFAAGAMIYVVVEELIPEMTSGDDHSNIGTVAFAFGFSMMMVLDTALS